MRSENWSADRCVRASSSLAVPDAVRAVLALSPSIEGVSVSKAIAAAIKNGQS
jgi:hypothetical protein